MAVRPALMRDVNRYIAGDDAAGDAICEALAPALQAAARRFLAPGDADCDDVVQDTLLAVLGYLRRAGIAPDNPEAFAVTAARNRCLNLHLWRRRRAAVDVDSVADQLPDRGASTFDLLAQRERYALLGEAIGSLDDRCRQLLNALYRDDRSVAELRSSLGLASVQAVYYRRNICLRRAQEFFNRRLFGGLGRESGAAAGTAVTPREREDGDG